MKTGRSPVSSTLSSAAASPLSGKANSKATARSVFSETSLMFVLLSLSFGFDSLPAQSWVETRFTSGAEDWTVVNWDGTGTPVQPTWHSTGGNPDGYLRSGDVQGDGFWRAPASFHGNWSAAYGGTLGYDAFASDRDWKMNDMYLVGNAGVLSYWFPSNPLSSWTTFSVKLDAGAGWQFGWNYDSVGTLATDEQIRSVLANVTNVLIRQEYAWGSDDSGLDNVLLFAGGPTTPRLIGSGFSGTNFTFSLQTTSNVTYTVEYNDDLRTTNWLFHHALTGNGSLMSCLIPMTNGTQRFFRVRQP